MEIGLEAVPVRKRRRANRRKRVAAEAVAAMLFRQIVNAW